MKENKKQALIKDIDNLYKKIKEDILTSREYLKMDVCNETSQWEIIEIEEFEKIVNLLKRLQNEK